MSTITMERTACASRVTADRTAAGPARLTRRGRWVVSAILLALILGLSLFLGSGSVATRDSGSESAPRSVVVDPGQSLWGIASDVAAPGETREAMYQIEKLNQLESTTLVPGQTLLLPAS